MLIYYGLLIKGFILNFLVIKDLLTNFFDLIIIKNNFNSLLNTFLFINLEKSEKIINSAFLYIFNFVIKLDSLI